MKAGGIYRYNILRLTQRMDGDRQPFVVTGGDDPLWRHLVAAVYHQTRDFLAQEQ
ncbi:hypothetical protein [Sodalis-like endosymbiont of Proechinophthirus fluctus]|uniref:hypothetical protein n=1 Tax=Sodalis-like endosymbiont of Proechinophthirus fluctus TaxID=1462730 RepID=UPI00164F49D5|nr:hypothetical protein [Sodalis-like endosymbiont of Proechinophthirus fluctus]